MLLAHLAAKGGADAGEIRIRDLGAGRDRPDVIHGYNACWTRDGRGFFYAQRFASENDAKKRGGVRAWYHRLGDSPSSDRMLVSWDADASWVYFMTSEDGRYAAMVAEKGLVDQIFILDLGDSSAKPFEILAGLGTNHTPLDWVGDTFFVRTKHNAPRTRVIALDLREGTAAKPRAIVPESTDVIADAIITDERLVIHYLSDVHGVLRVFSLDGTLEGEIALPGIGRVGWPLSARPSTPELFFSFESFLSPAAVYTCDVSARAATVYRAAATTPDASRYETTQVFYPARDGTRVPMFITAAKGLALDGTHPVFLTGYGGYGATVQPSYSAEVPLWLEMGGVYVLANIRGGGEYGEEWHRAGMLEHKQTSFNDFIAAAEYLVEKGYTTRGRIAIHGHSNGGLLMGAVLTQRPDLWGAVVANAGHYDMLRYHRFTAGASWVSEYGSADNAAQFAYLRAYSPLQNVKAGTCYPPTLLLVAAQDDRVVPLHGYKFAAALQAAQSCDAPILLRVAENSSHSYSSSQELVAERADMWSFIAAKLGVSP
jgi:prolyl oligopeptidase